MTMTIKECCERVYAGRRQLRELHIDPNLKNIEIAIGERAWAELVAEYRRDLEAQDSYRLYVGGPFAEHDFTSFKIFGITARCSSDIGTSEIRFRSEVTL